MAQSTESEVSKNEKDGVAPEKHKEVVEDHKDSLKKHKEVVKDHIEVKKDQKAAVKDHEVVIKDHKQGFEGYINSTNSVFSILMQNFCVFLFLIVFLDILTMFRETKCT